MSDSVSVYKLSITTRSRVGRTKDRGYIILLETYVFTAKDVSEAVIKSQRQINKAKKLKRNGGKIRYADLWVFEVHPCGSTKNLPKCNPEEVFSWDENG